MKERMSKEKSKKEIEIDILRAVQEIIPSVVEGKPFCVRSV